MILDEKNDRLYTSSIDRTIKASNLQNFYNFIKIGKHKDQINDLNLS